MGLTCVLMATKDQAVVKWVLIMQKMALSIILVQLKMPMAKFP